MQSEVHARSAQVGISSVWYEGNTCNMHLNELAAEVKLGVQEAGLVGYRFNTIGVSDAISMGTDGMSFSLQSRDLIADSIETVSPRPRLSSAGRTANHLLLLDGTCISLSVRGQSVLTPQICYGPSTAEGSLDLSCQHYLGRGWGLHSFTLAAGFIAQRKVSLF